MDTHFRDFSYLDDVSIRVSFGGDPTGPPDEVFETWVHSPVIEPGMAWNESSYLEVLKPILWAEGGDYPLFNILKVNKSQASWGASGAGAEILLFVFNGGATGIIGGAAWAATVAAFRRFSEWSSWNGEPLSRDEAIERAIWKVRQVFGEGSQEDLTVLEEEYSPQNGQWKIRLRRSDNTTYEVTMGLADGLPNTVHISRRASDATNGQATGDAL